MTKPRRKSDERKTVVSRLDTISRILDDLITEEFVQEYDIDVELRMLLNDVADIKNNLPRYTRETDSYQRVVS